MKKFITKTIAIVLLATSFITCFTQLSSFSKYPHQICCYENNDDIVKTSVSIFDD